METRDSYNYRHFRATDYEFLDEVGPGVGETLDLRARTLDGDPVRLADLRGRPVVMETGSVTCGIYADRVGWWRKVAERHPEARFILLYVREAHPGARTDAHGTWEDKRRAASRLAEEWGEWRDVWIDDLEGSGHRMLGELPVMMYILDPEGRVVLRANWSDPDAAEQALNALDRGADPSKVQLRDHLPRPWIALNGLSKGGVRAIWDFARSFPALVAKRIRYRRRLRERRD